MDASPRLLSVGLRSGGGEQCMGLYAVRGEGAGSRRWDVEGSWPAGMGVVETSKDQRTTSRVRAYGFAA